MLIKESPDRVFLTPDGSENLTIDNAYPFGIIDDKLYGGYIDETHDDIGVGYREDYTYPGRIWFDDKVISFWVHPKDRNTLKVIIKELENIYATPIWSDSEFRIEIMKNGKAVLIPLRDYKKSEKRSKAELGKQHMETPRLKKLKSVPPGMGSKKKYPNSRPGETIAQTRYRMYAESILEWNEFIETLE